MGRRKPPRKTTASQQPPLVNQPTVNSGRVIEGKTEFLVNEIAKNPQALERLFSRPETAGFMMQISHHRSGPLPDSEELARYERISPGFAREIMEMAKDEQKFRHTQGKSSLSGAIWKDRIGQIFGLVCVFVFSYIAYSMIEKEAFGWATTLLGVELVALTGVFVLGRKDKTTEQKAPTKRK